MVMVSLPVSIRNQIKELAKASDKEICGLIVRLPNRALHVLPSLNIADNPQKNFKVSLECYEKAKELGTIIYLYHSHVNGFTNFSGRDKVQMQELNAATKKAGWHPISWYLFEVQTGTERFAQQIG